MIFTNLTNAEYCRLEYSRLLLSVNHHDFPQSDPAPGFPINPPLAGFPSMAMAADMLAMPCAVLQLSENEARIVVNYMHPKRFAEGTVFIREGDAHNTGFLALVLEGEVTVENIVVSRKSPITVTVLGPGSMHGDLGLIDGLPRSASCTAATNLCCALLTREGMSQLLKDHPEICAKLVMAVAMRWPAACATTPKN
jgi:CRP/FNR family cyclic AMP-dependent transcriptional regulator